MPGFITGLQKQGFSIFSHEPGLAMGCQALLRSFV